MKCVEDKVLMLGKNIEKAMKARGVGIAELALKTGVSKEKIENIIIGSKSIINDVDTADIMKIASALDIDEDVLFLFDE